MGNFCGLVNQCHFEVMLIAMLIGILRECYYNLIIEQRMASREICVCLSPGKLNMKCRSFDLDKGQDTSSSSKDTREGRPAKTHFFIPYL